MKVGIVGLPSAGKSTLFNALTKAGAAVGAYPFTTIDPNLAEVAVSDPRLEVFASAVGASHSTHDSITFVDIAGLVPGAHKGEGLGNQFLANIRETDAIVHVVRCFNDDQVSHTEGRIDPLADAEIIETELIMADLAQAERRYERVAKQAKSGEAALVAEATWLQALIEALQAGKPASSMPPPVAAPHAQANLFSLTAKPVLYLANVSEDDATRPIAEVAPEIENYAGSIGAEAVAISVKLEAELAELDAAEAEALRGDLGAGERGLDQVVKAAFSLLNLITFFTGGKDSEAKAWSIPRGSTAVQAAGQIHTDIEKGFVKAEVINVGLLSELGSWSAARDAGKLRLEGRDYVVQDGDAITVKFTF